MNETSDGDQFSAEQCLVDLMASFLATNGVSIAAGFSIAQKLIEARIVSIENDSSLISFPDEDTIFSAIISNCYPRGNYVSRLIANRMFRSLEQINSQGGVAFLRLLSAASIPDIRSRLLPLYGVGEKFVKSYSLLAGIVEP